MNTKKADAIVVAGLIGAAACLGPSEKRPEPKESRDATVTIRSETPYTTNTSSVTVNNKLAFRVEFPKKKWALNPGSAGAVRGRIAFMNGKPIFLSMTAAL